jgi:Tripartite tricarboxylate transporter TctB family
VHRSASLALSVLIMVVSGYGVFVATAWPWKAALFPLAIGIPLFCLAVAEALWSLLGTPAGGAEGKEFQLAIGPQTARRTAIVVGWILGFFAGVLLLGFPLAVPLFVFLFLKLQGREGWVLSLVITLAVWGVFYGLFDRLLHLPFPAGWLFG